jgi:hypothetical protein
MMESQTQARRPVGTGSYTIEEGKYGTRRRIQPPGKSEKGGVGRLEGSLLGYLFVCLELVADFEAGPVLERHAAVAAFAHFHDVFLHVLER